MVSTYIEKNMQNMICDLVCIQGGEIKTLYDYNLARDLTNVMTLTLFHGHRYVSIINWKLFSVSCPL